MPEQPLLGLDPKYEVLRKLHQGGMGAVYLVRHRELDAVRVVKVMLSEYELEPEMRERFLREARFATRLRHPNIAEIYDLSINAAGTAFIVMEHIEGRNLKQLLEAGGPLDATLAVTLARQALRALGYLHRQGFVHRDISPDNLMLTRDVDGGFLVKLIDLGIAKPPRAEPGLTQTGMFLGKLHYASPEQLGGPDGRAIVDARSDIYSFGVLLYRLVTGEFPIAGADSSAIMAGHLFRPPVPFETVDAANRVPSGLRSAILRALAKDPEARFQTTAEFATALDPAGGAAVGPDLASRSDPATLRLDQPATGEPGAPDGPKFRETTLGSEARRYSTVRWLPLVVALVLVAGVVVVWPWSRDLTPPANQSSLQPATASLETPSTVPDPGAGAVPGILVVDAVPWGEVSSVEDAAGESIALVGNRYTPWALRLPPGTYTVTVRGPNQEVRTTEPLVVLPGESPARPAAVLVFGKADAVTYFRRQGFS